jgi:hypothetical protein
MRKTRAISTCVAFAALCSAHATQAARLQLTTGVDYSNGEYGQSVATHTFVVPFAARVTFGNVSVRAAVPYIRVRGPADVSPAIEDSGGARSSNSGSGSSGGGSESRDSSGSGRSGSGSESSGSGSSTSGSTTLFSSDRSESGLGDATLAVAYSFNDIASTRLYIDITGRAVLPTGDDLKGLGNGTSDYAALTEIGWDGRGGGIYVGGGRRFLEANAGVDRLDGWQLSAGFWRNTGRITVVGMQYNWRDASTLGGIDPSSIDAYLTRRLSTGWKIEVSVGAGLSDADADYAAGLNFTWRSTDRR